MTQPNRPTQPRRRNWSPLIKSTGNGLPSRVVLHGVEGIGKTSFGAYAPDPIFLMAKGETGLETLIDSGRLPQVPHFPELADWADVISAVKWLTCANEPGDVATSVP